MERINRLIARQDRIIRESEDATIRTIKEILGQSYFQLERELLRRWPRFTREAQPNLLPAQRSLLLTNELKTLLPLLDLAAFEGIQDEFRQLLLTADQDGITLGSELAKVYMGDEFVNRTATLPLEQIAIAAEKTTERLRRVGYKFSEEGSIVIGMGIAQGWGARRTATALKQRFNISRQHAEAEARTSVIEAGNEAAKRVYADHDIDYVQWNATADFRVCPICAARNMRVYKRDDVRIPIHYNDRCRLTPFKMEWQEKGLTDDDFARNFRKETLDKLEGAPNYGVAPFEKQAGLTKAPKAVWTP